MVIDMTLVIPMKREQIEITNRSRLDCCNSSKWHESLGDEMMVHKFVLGTQFLRAFPIRQYLGFPRKDLRYIFSFKSSPAKYTCSHSFSERGGKHETLRVPRDKANGSIPNRDRILVSFIPERAPDAVFDTLTRELLVTP